MNKPLNPTVHGWLDYIYAVFLLLAPGLFGFAGTGAATVFYLLGFLHAGLSLLTQYPLGLVKTIPFTVHAGIEFATAVILVGAPWLFGFAALEMARNIAVLSGVALMGVWLFTDYRAAGPSAKIHPLPRSEEDEYRGRRAA